MEYSVVIPAHNEQKTVCAVVEGVAKVLKSTKKSFEIIVVNDNSTDNSLSLLKKTKKTITELSIIDRKTKPGVGYAKRAGLKQAKGNIIITMDGDGSHDPKEIPKLLEKLDHADMVSGSRYVKKGKASMALSRVIVSGLFNLIFRTLLNVSVKDFTSGFRAFKRTVIEKNTYQSKTFGIYIEISLLATIQGFKLTEVPITYRKREYGVSHLSYLRQGPEYLWVVMRMIGKKLVS